MHTGLSSGQIISLRKTFGNNEIPHRLSDSGPVIFFRQFKNYMPITLIMVGIISLLIREYLDAVFIFLITVLNGFLGYVQEVKAQKDISSLTKMIVPMCRVIRDGREILLPARELVPGDIVNLQTGDQVPADGEVIESKSLLVNESSLTGESISINKAVKDSVFMSTTVMGGHALVKIQKTGINTSFGKIASETLLICDEKSPLEKQIDRFGKIIGVAILFIAIGLFLLGVLQGRAWYEVFLITISTAVAVMPEGLPVVLTITLAIGMQKMARKKAVMRRLSTTECLGSVQVICTDKTGTLTKNELTVKNIWLANGSEYLVSGTGFSSQGEVQRLDRVGDFSFAVKDLTRFIEIGVVCNNASLMMTEGNSETFDILGDTTEGALLILAKKLKLEPDEIKNNFEIIDEKTFNNEEMIMAVLVQNKKTNKFLVFAKGAPEKIIRICSISENGREKIYSQTNEMGGRGLRVLGLAFKELVSTDNLNLSLVDGLSFCGLVGIYDSPREEVKSTIEKARKAGIRTVMLTGDNALTALKIAKEIGLADKNSEVVTGEQLKTYSREIFQEKLDKVNIFARVTPLDKLAIVDAFQKKGLVTAVTGDGVNDAPALKLADVGVAMGKTGTDVAKEASDMVIMDDNYATLVQAVEEGRAIYDNIIKTLKYLISQNLGETLVIVVSMLLGWPLILLPQQILWINLVSDSLPAVALGFDQKDQRTMTKPPRNQKIPFLDIYDWQDIVVIGIVQALVAVIVFWLLIFNLHNEAVARLGAFSSIVLMAMVIAFIIRGKNQKFLGNKFLNFSVCIILSMQAIILLVPFLRGIFSR